MKNIIEFINEKLKITKSKSKYNIELLNTKLFAFDDALETFNKYFDIEHDKIITGKRKLPIKKGYYSSNNFVTCSELTTYDIGEYILWVGNYDYGLVFLPCMRKKIDDNDVIDMLCDTEVAKHYLYGDNFLQWIKHINIKELNDIFSIKKGDL